MEDEKRQERSAYQKQQSSYPSSQNQMYNQMNKTYDEFDTQKSVVSIIVKSLPILIYILLKFMTQQQLSLFILVTLLMAVDFWITKNILGPKLAGLKWFSIEDQNEKQKWCFASAPETRVVSKPNVIFFWFPQIIAILFWIIIFIINLITLGFFWAILAIYSTFLLVINFAFFFQCKGEHQNKLNFFTKKLGISVYTKQQQLKQDQASFN